MSLVVGVDVGGTFTDVYVHDVAKGHAVSCKVPSTPGNFVEGFMAGVHEALSKLEGDDVASVTRVLHGATIATNAILTESGARLGIVMTEGFRDTLYIGLGWRPHMYDLDMDPVEPLFLAPRRRAAEVRERVDARGNVLRELDEDQVRAVTRRLVEEEQVESLVVCYLHSYANPTHERRTREIIAEVYPGLSVTISSDVLPKPREYNRLVVSAFDAYVKPVMTRYVAELSDTLAKKGINGQLLVMQSNGGVAGIEAVTERPVRTILSGLAAGVIGAAHVGKRAGHQNCITLDMGGTSADVALIRGGTPIISNTGSFEDWPLHLPMVDVRTIGAGGSSIAFVDEAGGLRVGPKSAGAYPGPACYDRGGAEPTVTDASIVLGYLNPETFAGGLDLKPSKSYEAIEQFIARPLGLSVTEAALGIHVIVNANMAQTLRRVSIKRGYDPREFTFVPFGGAGAVQAGRLAEEIGLTTILIPPSPGVLSAMGLMLAPVQHDALANFGKSGRTTMVADIRRILGELDETCAARMRRDLDSAVPTSVQYFAEMRYIGQSHTLEIPIRQPLTEESVTLAIQEFHESHQTTFSYADREGETEFTGLRSVHSWSPDGYEYAGENLTTNDQVLEPRPRPVCFDSTEGYRDTPVYWRYHLPANFSITGPAIIEQPDTTTVVYPGHKARMDSFGNIICEVG